LEKLDNRSVIQPLSGRDRKRLIRGVCILVMIGGFTIWLAFSGHLQFIIIRIVFAFESKEHMRLYLQSWGSWAPIAFIALQMVQVLISPIPGELTGVVGGFFFGTWRAAVYSSFGLTLGSAIAFLLARLIGLPFVKLFIAPDHIAKLEFLAQARGQIALWALFILPGFPKDVLSYLLGLTPLPFLKFIIICCLGRLPGTVLLGVGGAALYKENWNLAITLVAVCIIFAVVFYFKREQITSWINKRIGSPGPGSG
jgi:uncharacterized membrane protein YdjX (TVP38/TMEM64 family)